MHPKLSLALSAVLIAPAATAEVIYVNASAIGANDGSSWADAYTDIQSALLVDAIGDQVWVAAGSYRPSASGDRTASFIFDHLREYYGGFAGTETTLAQRAGLFDSTILSGDLLGDDGPGFTNVADNSIHVVKHFNALAIDGFTITGGNATEDDGGGGIYGFPVIHARIENCTFRANRTDGWGGALLLQLDSEPLVRRCVFIGNHADGGGGGLAMSFIDSTGTIESCRFLGNTASQGGGAATYVGLQFVDCEFSGNAAQVGGAIWAHGVGLQNCTIAGNSAIGAGSGGGVHALGPYLRGCILWGNTNGGSDVEAAQLFFTIDDPNYANVQACCVEGWTGQTHPGPGNLFGDPRFVDPGGADGILGSLDDDLRLRLGSSCVETGGEWTDGRPSRDLGLGLRLVDSLACDGGGVLDIGAYERQSIDGSTSYCAQPPTSLGVPAEISAPCVVGVAGGELRLRVGPVPARTAILFAGTDVASTPFGIDTLCVGGDIRRLPAPVRSGQSLGLLLDLSDPSAAAFVPGSTWHIQSLFRDGGALRLSDATTISFKD